MSFLHPEFFYWMFPPISILFYFWQTQKSPQSTPFRENILNRLRSPEITMGLRGRNTLFLMAAILLIAAMAQPVVFEDATAAEGRADVLVALDLSIKSPEALDAEKRSAMDVLRLLRGENIALVGYDTKLYRIAPYTTDIDTLARLIKGLDKDTMQRSQSDHSVVGKLQSEGIKIIIGDPILEYNTQLSGISDEIAKIKKFQSLYTHIPLFYYPLGLAMLLIWIALSSMSKRRDVPLLAILLMLSINETPSSAGILDFRVLDEGYRAYEDSDYTQSVASFKAYQKGHDSPEIRYNLANALYKAGEYQQALYWYRQVYTTDHLLAQRTIYNLRVCKQQINHDTEGRIVKKSADISNISQEGSIRKQGQKIDKQPKTRLYSM